MRINEIRFKDKVKYTNLNYMNVKEIKEIKVEKVVETKVYTFDFLGKLEFFNNNESVFLNIGGLNSHNKNL